jgi:hypothetical protein
MPAGSGSLSVTLRATPGPRFETTIVNAAVSPALIVPESAVFTTLTSGHATSTDAESLPPPSFAASTVAVLSTVPHVAGVVGETTWTLKLAPAGRLAFEQLRSVFASLSAQTPSSL